MGEIVEMDMGIYMHERGYRGNRGYDLLGMNHAFMGVCGGGVEGLCLLDGDGMILIDSVVELICG